MKAARGILLTGRWMLLAGLGLALAAAGVALAAGYGRTFVMPAGGTVAVTNLQVNAVWRPVVMSLRCPDSAARTVTVSRIVNDVRYPISAAAGTAQTFIYEFDAPYWFGLSNVLQMSVAPACTGSVEVIFE